MILDFIKYLFKAKSLHGTHSPFIYEFYENVFDKDLKIDKLNFIEKQRSKLIKDESVILFKDFGSGAKVKGENKQVKVKSIARRSLKSAKWGRSFYRMASNYPIKHIIELGTSLGVSTAYLASANKNNCVTSLEGSKEVLNIAEGFFKTNDLSNIQTVQGDIDLTLPEVLKGIDKVDLVFFDANHRLVPTVRYFDLCFTKAHENSIFIFDDIYWSAEMKQAWNQIKKDPRVRQSIDLFEIGIVMFRKSQEKEHFTLKY